MQHVSIYRYLQYSGRVLLLLLNRTERLSSKMALPESVLLEDFGPGTGTWKAPVLLRSLSL